MTSLKITTNLECCNYQNRARFYVDAFYAKVTLFRPGREWGGGGVVYPRRLWTRITFLFFGIEGNATKPSECFLNLAGNNLHDMTGDCPRNLIFSKQLYFLRWPPFRNDYAIITPCDVIAS